jgi:hypothetical protein
MEGVMPVAEVTIWSEGIQYGFAGLAFLLIGVICWMFRQQINATKETNTVILAISGVIAKTNEVIATNTLATNSNALVLGNFQRSQMALSVAVLSKPCMLTLDKSVRQEIIDALSSSDDLAEKVRQLRPVSDLLSKDLPKTAPV